ncbi:hypothetical protein Zm00014a_004664 [Zea mays]|uniref:Uncharacterized protein n=2 Tax=Zea mays TaxID=4577 RepID=B4FAN4_MAIZE|nr:uncharacterized protein LOC100192045 isoform 1 [Zea mays]ACF79177.1 unknown [Zea mays]AQK80229.1 hypothetical protein ZEAMMB73_Zm00001d036060 [Zea mays]ONM61158.1 hypothetical protein ZEAMMB73_Zm00001d022589 [Zea mays]PWZ13457.1 hypothetical protein Zm00014a_004664 [Zea mays]PWZ13458.1 hypothetical protein Zm00014a_004664 [Zea mays]|eukprot:NP_001337630.1 uncharacterized protein LOC100192045 [Zea mays]
MEVESAMLASSLNPAPTLSASATTRFPASSTPNRRPGSLHGRRVCDSPISVEGVSSSPDRRPGSLHARDSLLSMEGESAMLTWIGYPAPALSMEGVSPIAASSLANRVRHGNTGEAVGSLVDAHHGETNGGKGKGYIFHPGRMWRGSSNSVTLRTTIYAQVNAALRKIRDTSEFVQSFASEHLKTPLEELVKGNKNKSTTELWVEKFYKKVTNLPEPFPHDLVEKLEEYLDKLEGQPVDLSSLLYDHQLIDAYQNSTDILQSTIFTQQYVERVLANERDKMKCCSIEYSHPKQSSQAFVYGGILLAGFIVYSLVIFFSSPVR